MSSKTITSSDEARDIVASNIDNVLRTRGRSINDLADSLGTDSVDLRNTLTDIVVVFAVAAELDVKFADLVRGIR